MNQDEPPAYLALDLWMALGFDDKAFDAYYSKNGWANTWSNLLGEVRNVFQPYCLETLADGEICVLHKDHIGPHMGESDVGTSDPLPRRNDG